ncbi:hypothetical protein ISN45_At03g043330 [Arabidopsis thaliana x Arabidopsis arenosa]|uniref:Uncharacterized protein n=2 Tax=Arabidopsis TaxID=3701 RepID=A0A8T2FCF1_ARASU|nr:hypothetical protein ISN45_At03g043330 [Arabidopsis thaliana x Arabidopsis arenosa]KAG7633955.1 hypothetical protein ISN44_As03g042250 [Arabidopsis suecica]
MGIMYMLRTRDLCALVCVPHTCDTETSSRTGAMGPIKPSSPTMHVTVGIKNFSIFLYLS